MLGSKKPGLKLVLTGLVLVTVLLTALLVHALWSYTARENVEDVVRQLNQEIVVTVRNELGGVRDQAVAAQLAVGSAFVNGIFDFEKQAGQRDFIFLSLLRAMPSVSWISIGTPQGNFYGAQRAADGGYRLVSIAWDQPAGQGAQTVYKYRVAGAEAEYESFETAVTDFNATAQGWYERAVAEGCDGERCNAERGAGWNLVSHFPDGDRAGISTSMPLVANTKFGGVINVVIELELVSQFLSRQMIGEGGTVVVIDREGRIVASADPRAIEQQRRGLLPMLDELGRDDPRLELIQAAIKGNNVDLARLADVRSLELTSPADGNEYFVTFSPVQFRDWVIATVIPAHDFLASIEQSAETLAIALVVLVVAMAALAVVLANNLVARPLTRIAAQLGHIENFRLDQVTRIPSRLREFDGLSNALVQMSQGLASFAKYMPTELVRTLVSQGVEAKPGGEHENLTVMFADLAGFTSLSEFLGESVVPILTEYLETASSAVLSHRGTIDKFIGDAVMAFWGAPIENPQHARDACAAALAIHAGLMARRPSLPADDPRAVLQARIGINTGRMLVGNVGSADRLNYTVIGDPVNVASRLEALNKRYGTAIMIGEETRRAAGDAIVARRLDWVAVYGRAEGMAIYELLGLSEAPGGGAFGWVRDYEAGLEAYRDKDFPRALALFEAVDAARAGGDPPSQVLIARCRALIAAPPAADWSPIAVQMEK
ncbi:MAG TPA: adenylate/guanylate cyclase domain-containing protein [Dongiaceae bacterium]